MSAAPAGSVLQELRPPGGWSQPARPLAEPPEPPAAVEPARLSATAVSVPRPAPVAVTHKAVPISGEKHQSPHHAEADWRLRAACRGLGAALFFPERGELTQDAKEVCAGCPVRAECLEYALQAVEKFGIWGGKSERQRRRMRKARQHAGRAA